MALQFKTDQIANSAITSAKIATNAVGASELDLSESYNFAGTVEVVTPTAASHAANKGYVDAIQAGLHWKDSVRVKSTANMALGSAVVNGATVDGITLATNDRILLASQSTASENGIYIVAASGAASRATDLDAAAEFPGAAMFVREGTLYGDTGWVCTNDSVTVGSTPIAFSQFTGGGSLVAGNGISISGNTVSASLAASGGLAFDGTSIEIDAAGVTDAMLAGSISNGKLSNSSVTVNSGTGITGGGSVNLGGSITLNVGGLTNSEISNSAAIAYSKLSLTGAVVNDDLAGSISDGKLSTIATANKVSGSAVQLNANSALEDSTGLRLKSATAGAGLDMSNAQVMSVSGVTNDMISNSAAIAYSKLDLSGAVANDDLAGSIADSKLLQITTGNKVAGSAVQLQSNKGISNVSGLGLVLEGTTLSVGANGLKVADGQINFLQMAWQPRKEGLSPDGSAVAFNLSNNIPDPDWRDGVIITRNGQVLTQLASGADEIDEYVVSESDGTTTVTFGSAPAADDVLQVMYYA